MKYSGKNLKKVISLFLAFVMLISPLSNVLPIAAATTSDTTSDVTSYMVEVKNMANWTLVSYEDSTGPVTLTYTVEDYTKATNGSDNYGVTATTDVGAEYPYLGCGKMSNNYGANNEIMKEGYTYSFTISMVGTKIVYTGSYTSPEGEVGTITFTGNDSYGTDANFSGATNFGIFNGEKASAKLVNVTCVDSNGNDLGVRSNKACYITPENATSYTVKANDVNCFYMSNKTPSDGPVTMTYTVDECTKTFSAAHNGLVATTESGASAGWPHPSGSMRFATNTNILMMEGYTYSVTMSLDSNNKIKYAGNYVAPDGTVTRITNGAILKNIDGPGSASTQFGIFLSDIAQGSRPSITLSNVTFTDGKGNDLGVRTNKASHIALETDTTSYTVEVSKANNWTLVNFEDSTGPVTLTYTVESYTEIDSITHGTNYGVTATKDPTVTWPYTGGNGKMSFSSGENAIMKEGFTYSFNISMEETNIVYSGSYTSPEGKDGTITFKTTSYGEGNFTGDATNFGIYTAAQSSAKLVNVTCVDAEGNNLGVRTNRPSHITPETDTTAYTVKADNVNCFYMSNETPTTGPVTMTYTVDACTQTISTNNGLAASIQTPDDVNHPYTSGSMRYQANSDCLMKEGYTYSVTMSLDSNNKIIFTGSCVAPNGTITALTTAPINKFLTSVLDKTEGNGSESTQFGLFLSEIAEGSRPSISLSNVRFIDGKGNNLGVKTNQKSNIMETAPEKVPYTVEVKNVNNWTLVNYEDSTGPITLTYTVESYTGNSKDNYGVTATKAPTEAFPFINGNGKMSNNYGENTIMKEGYTYSFTISMDGEKLVYSGSYTSPEGEKGTITFTGNDSYGTGAFSGGMTYFGIYTAETSSAKLVNVTCVDEKGNNLGVRTNRPSYITPADTTAYTVKANDVNCFYMSNKTPSEGPVTMTYTVDECTETFNANNGLAASIQTPADSDTPYTSGSMRYKYGSDMMQVGYTYSVTMSLDSNNKIIFTGSYVAPDGTITALTTSVLDKTEGSGSKSTQFGLYLGYANPKPSISLSNVTFTDAEGNNLGVKTYQGSFIAPETEPEKVTYTVEVSKANNWTFFNLEDGKGQVTLTYTVESYKEAADNKHDQIYSVTATKDPTATFPYTDGNGKMSFSRGENAIMKEGYTYSFAISMIGTKIVYAGSYISPEGEEGTITFDTQSFGTGDFSGDATNFGIYISAQSSAKLVNVTCVDNDGNDLGLQSYRANVLIYGSGEAMEYPGKDTEIDTCYDVEVVDEGSISIGNILLPETSNMYMEYKVESAEYLLQQEGVLMSRDLSSNYPYTTGALNYKSYNEGITDSSILLEVGAEYIIRVERREDGFVAKVWKTKDGETTLHLFNTSYKVDWSDATQYFGLWFGDEGAGANANFKLTNVKCYDENKNDLGVQSNKAIVTHRIEVDHSKIDKYNVMIVGRNTFLCNDKTVGSEVGTEYFMTYTVDKVDSTPTPLGLVGTEDNTAAFPYIDIGVLKYGTKEGELNLLEEGATYHIRYMVIEGGYYCDVVCIKDGEVKRVNFKDSHYTQDADGVKNPLDKLAYFGLWVGDEVTTVKLKNVSYYDARGNDLGVWMKEGKGVFSTEEIPLKKNTKVKQYYEIEVEEEGNVAIGNVKIPETSKMYIEYKVKSAKYLLQQEGVMMSQDLTSSYPYVTGALRHHYYEEGNTDSSVLLDVGAEYIICIERQEDGFKATAWKTKDGVTTLHFFLSNYKQAWSDETQFFGLWFGEEGLGANISFKLTDFKCYDENNNNLGVQCKQAKTLVQRGPVEDYALCEATYYCESNGCYFVLNKDKTLKFVNKDTVSEGKYTVSMPKAKMVIDGKTTSYDYLYTKITDAEGLEYMRLFNYKINFETGTDTHVKTQTFSNKNGYFATRPEDPAMDGYEFLGWYLSDGTEYNFDEIVTESITLYAKYSGDGGIVFAADGIVEPESDTLVIYIIIGAIILLAGAAVCIGIIMRGKKSGRNKK